MTITHSDTVAPVTLHGFETTFPAELTATLQNGLNELAREKGLIQRQSKISGQSLVQGLVFGFLENPQASEVQIAQSVSRAGEPVTSQAVNARLTEIAADVFKNVLERIVTMVLRQPLSSQTGASQTGASQTLLERFSEVMAPRTGHLRA